MTKNENNYWIKQHILWNIIWLPTVIIPNLCLLVNWDEYMVNLLKLTFQIYLNLKKSANGLKTPANGLFRIIDSHGENVRYEPFITY